MRTCDLPTEPIEGDEDYEPKCPVCGHQHGEMYEHNLGDGETEDIHCYSCDAPLTLTASCSIGWQLDYEPPTESDLAAYFDRCCAAARREHERRIMAARRLPDRRTIDRDLFDRDRERWPTWAAFDGWPDWVPVEVRASIEKFHLDEWDRGPASWLRCARSSEAPVLGSTHTVCEGGCEEASGRYVHAWNNIGRLITATGRVVYCSVGRGRVSAFGERSGPTPAIVDAMPGVR